VRAAAGPVQQQAGKKGHTASNTFLVRGLPSTADRASVATTEENVNRARHRTSEGTCARRPPRCRISPVYEERRRTPRVPVAGCRLDTPTSSKARLLDLSRGGTLLS
jgi:hypothetical protein